MNNYETFTRIINEYSVDKDKLTCTVEIKKSYGCDIFDDFFFKVIDARNSSKNGVMNRIKQINLII
jgi:hypothetical protein